MSTGEGARTRVVEAVAVPLVLLRVLPVALAAAGFALIPVPYAIGALVLAGVGAVLPGTLATWGAAVVLAATQLLSAGPDIRPFVVLALVHALHVLGGLCLALPVRGRLQLGSLWAPARRWLVIELGAQPVLAIAMLAQQAGLRSLLPAGVAVIGVAAGVVMMIVLLRVLAARR